MGEEYTIPQERVEHYFLLTRNALQIAQDAECVDKEKTRIILDMAKRYVDDATHFAQNNNFVLAYAALNYAHGWLDCGARLGFFLVEDDQLFTVDPSDYPS